MVQGPTRHRLLLGMGTSQRLEQEAEQGWE